MITAPIYQSEAEEIGDALIEHVVTKYCVPDCIIKDQDSAFISSHELYQKIISQNKNIHTL